MSKKLLAVIGTRPDGIKMCPLINELKKRNDITLKVLTTGQHKEMLSDVLATFSVSPDYDLSVMKKGQDLFDITLSILTPMREILKKEAPDAVLVHGDTTSAFVAALSAFYLKIPVYHVEAGLRTGDIFSPYPEEFNRSAIALISEHHFAPTEGAARNLLAEGIGEGCITVTGNTVVDALNESLCRPSSTPILDWIDGHPFILLTLHRRESLGRAMAQTLEGVSQVLLEYPELRAVYPLHPNPEIHSLVKDIFGDNENILLCPPLNVVDFHTLLSKCYLCLTDSGGVQEEALSLGKPLLVARNTTERSEGLLSGGIRLVGTKKETVYRGLRALLDCSALYFAMSRSRGLYGDGRASRNIADMIEKIV